MKEQSNAIKIQLPLTEEIIDSLRAGDCVLLSGSIYTARDAAHLRMEKALDEGKPLPVSLRGEGIYYLGPAPAAPGQVIGSAGPTSSYRMDRYTPRLLDQGLRFMVGKGQRSSEVKEAMQEHGAVYFAATGGAGALLSKCVVDCRLVAYEDLGPEAIYRLELKDFPAIVATDRYGSDCYDVTEKPYAKKQSGDMSRTF